MQRAELKGGLRAEHELERPLVLEQLGELGGALAHQRLVVSQ